MDLQADSECYKYNAMFASNQGKYSQATIKYSRAVRLDPSSYSTTFKYASYLTTQKKYNQAGKMFGKSVMLNPRATSAYIDWANTIFLTGDYDGSMDIFKKLLRIKPDMGIVYNNIGFILYSQQKFEEALASFEKAFLLDRRQNIALFNCSLLLFHQNRIEKGLIKFKEGIKATEHGDYPVRELIDIYSVQVLHSEQKLKEDLDKDQREFLEGKIRGMQRIVQLLKDEGRSNIPNPDETDNQDYETGMDMINSSPILKRYSEYLDIVLTSLFSKIFISNQGYYLDTDTLIVTVSYCIEMIKQLGQDQQFNLRKMITCLEDLVETEDEGSLKDKITEVTKVPERVFENMINNGELTNLVHMISQKITLSRATSHLKKHDEEHSELDEVKLAAMAKLIDFLGAKGVDEKVEEMALWDSSVLVLLCFLNNTDGVDNAMNFAEDLCSKMEKYIEGRE